MSFKRDRGDYKGRIDWFTIILYLLLVVAGWFAVCGASYDFDISHLFMMGGRPMMQLLWIGLAVVIGFMVLLPCQEEGCSHLRKFGRPNLRR